MLGTWRNATVLSRRRMTVMQARFGSMSAVANKSAARNSTPMPSTSRNSACVQMHKVGGSHVGAGTGVTADGLYLSYKAVDRCLHSSTPTTWKGVSRLGREAEASFPLPVPVGRSAVTSADACSDAVQSTLGTPPVGGGIRLVMPPSVFCAPLPLAPSAAQSNISGGQ